MSIFTKVLKQAAKQHKQEDIKQTNQDDKKEWINQIYSDLAVLADKEDHLMDLSPDKFTSDHETQLKAIIDKSQALLNDLATLEREV